MIELFMGCVMEYLGDDISPEEGAFSKLVKWYFKIAKYTIKIQNESMREYLLELKEIKKSYHQGKPFVKNRTKGEKKGFNFRYSYLIESMLKRDNKEEATEYAIKHLDWIKRSHSERTYYRHKKNIRLLGIEV